MGAQITEKVSWNLNEDFFHNLHLWQPFP